MPKLRPVLSLAGCLLAGMLLMGRADPPPAATDRPAAPPAVLDATALAARIDEALAVRAAEEKVQPAPLADDAEFLRRVYLDLIGRIPSVAEARAFLADSSPNKRQTLIDQLLDSPGYSQNFTRFWRARMLPDDGGNIQFRVLVPDFEAWLRKRISANVAYDQLVKELLTTGSGAPAMNGLARQQGNPEGSPGAFFQVNENKPENLAAATSRLFLGVKLECAQCHDHPFAQWKREQFWSYAAFFAGFQPQRQRGEVVVVGGQRQQANQHSIKIPNTDKTVQAKFLDNSDPQWANGKTGTVVLADWMTQPENRFFARAAVNRLWAHCFGTGLIEPVDDLLSDQGAYQPELLDEIARQFAANKFDLKYLLRAIVSSQAYQRTSTVGSTPPPPQLFASMAVKGLTPEQLFDSLAQATGWQEAIDNDPRRRQIALFGAAGARGEFLAKFGNQTEKRTDVQTSILQALSLMNGKFIADATNVDRSELLAAVADAPFLDTGAKVETLYLAALSRKPTAKELERMTRYVNDGEPNKTLPDVFWALLNSSEFVFNH